MNTRSMSERLRLLADAILKLAKEAEENDSTAVFPVAKQVMIEGGYCLGCGELIDPTEQKTRGNHYRCYRTINDRIKAGELTENEAIRNGLLTPSVRTGRPKKKKTLEVLKKIEAVASQPVKTKAPKTKP